MKTKHQIPEPKEVDGKLECKECQRPWKSLRSYRLHWIRKHSKRGWNTTRNFKNNGLHPKQRLATNDALDKRDPLVGPVMKPENMQVNICPKCACRFAVMIIE